MTNMLKFPVLLILLLLLIYPVIAGTESYIRTSAYFQGDNGIVVDTDHQWNVGGNYQGMSTMNNIQGGAAHSKVVTGRGNSTFTKNTILHAKDYNLFDTSSELFFDGGGSFRDYAGVYDYKVFIPRSSSSGSNTEIGAGAQNESSTQGQLPSGQEIHTSASGMGDMAHTMTDEVIAGTDLSNDYRSEGGSGIYTASVNARMEAGANPDEATMDYRARVNEQYTTSGSKTGSYAGSLSIGYRDFSRPLGFGDGIEINATTETNTSVNVTEIEFSEPTQVE